MSDSEDVSAVLNSEDAPQVEESSELVVEEVSEPVADPEPVEEVSEPVADPEPVEDPEPVADPEPVEDPEPVSEEVSETSVEEVAANVRDILAPGSVEEVVQSDKQRLEKLEERVEELIKILRSVYKRVEIDDDKYVWCSEWNSVREKLNDA
jgi:hypothetical protein